jgi:hypothetical protein
VVVEEAPQVDSPIGRCRRWRWADRRGCSGCCHSGLADRTPEGNFFDENVVDAGLFFNNEQRWSPSPPLYAGHYRWLVASHDRNTLQSFYSVPRDFTIEVSLVSWIKIRRSLSRHWLAVTIRWRANAYALNVKVSLLRRGRIIWARVER